MTGSSQHGRPPLRIIDNATNFDDKLKRLMAEITAFLGEPEPLESERKFLIEYPYVAALERMPNCRRVEIIQTYLDAGENEESRVRQRGIDGNNIYTQTTKRKMTDRTLVYVERSLSRDEYLQLLMDADPTCRLIRKTRYCLTSGNQYFEIDVYPFWKDRAIIEIELSAENTPVMFPDCIRAIREVIGDERYKNAALATMNAGQ